MRILGIDPGATTGWCIYDSDAKIAVASGECEGPDLDIVAIEDAHLVDFAVIEEPFAHGPTRPEVVECAKVFARLDERVSQQMKTHCISRHETRRRLQLATHGVVRVANDATVWAAIKLLHGDGCDKKGGSLYGVKSHARAALAAAVAFTLPAAEKTKEETK